VIFVGKPKGKRPLRKPRRRWEDNIEMGLRDIGWGGKVWINLVQDRDQWRTLVKNSIFWGVTPCSLLKVNRRFGGTCGLNLEG
jgi:hypothetical protein